jgi:hypothetical protein
MRGRIDPTITQRAAYLVGKSITLVYWFTLVLIAFLKPEADATYGSSD